MNRGGSWGKGELDEDSQNEQTSSYKTNRF